jgi:serine/threonine protein kinase
VLVHKYKWSRSEAKNFADFLKPMLEYDTRRRATARQCLKHDWINTTLNPAVKRQQELDREKEKDREKQRIIEQSKERERERREKEKSKERDRESELKDKERKREKDKGKENEKVDRERKEKEKPLIKNNKLKLEKKNSNDNDDSEEMESIEFQDSIRDSEIDKIETDNHEHNDDDDDDIRNYDLVDKNELDSNSKKSSPVIVNKRSPFLIFSPDRNQKSNRRNDVNRNSIDNIRNNLSKYKNV